LTTTVGSDDVSLGESLQEMPSAAERNLPIMTSRKLAHMPIGVRPQQAWIESLSAMEDEKLGIIDLHPDIFGIPPRFVGCCLEISLSLFSNCLFN